MTRDRLRDGHWYPREVERTAMGQLREESAVRAGRWVRWGETMRGRTLAVDDGLGRLTVTACVNCGDALETAADMTLWKYDGKTWRHGCEGKHG